jgi:hypothetical protein
MYNTIDVLSQQFDTINTKYEKFFNKTLRANGLNNKETRNNFYSEIIEGITLSDDVVADDIPPPIQNLIPTPAKTKEGQDIQRPAQPSVAVEEALLNPADALVLKTPSKKPIKLIGKETTPKKPVLSEEEKLKEKEEAVIQSKAKQAEVKQKEKEQKAKEEQSQAVAQQEQQLGEGKPKRRIGKGHKKSKKPVMKHSSMFMNYLDDTDDKLLPNLPRKIVPYGL